MNSIYCFEKHAQGQTSYFICFLLFIFFSFAVSAQVTLGFQGGEIGDTWTYTSSGASALAISEASQNPNKVTGVTSLVVGGNTGGGNCFAGGSGNGPSTPRTFTFNPLDISTSNASTRTLTFNWGNRFPACNGTGWDSGENLTFTAFHDGVAQPPVTLATGMNNAQFSILSNSYTWTIPPCVSQFYFVVSVTTNRADELLFIDNVTLTAPQLNVPLSVSPINGNISVCSGSSENYSVNAQTAISYTWSGLPTGASFSTVNGTTGSSNMTIDWGTASPGNYILTVTPSNVCGTTGASQTLSITVLPPPTPLTISGPNSLCAGEVITLTSSYGTGNTWSPNGETTASITTSTPGTYTVSVTTSCGILTTSHSVALTPATLANITPDGPISFCAGGSVNLTSNSASGNSWSTGASTPSITVATAGTYVLTVTDVCGTSSASQQITLLPLPDSQISGSSSFCEGQQTLLTASGGDTYLWSTGETSTAINVSTAGNYNVTAFNSCGQMISSAVTVIENPLPDSQINGNSSFCEGQQTTLTASGGDTYLWSTGETSNSININTAGSYTVTAINSCGQTTSLPIIVTENPLPNPQITGSTSFCEGQQTTLTASGGDSYLWSTGETGTTINITSGGNYTVSATNSCGTTNEAITISVSSTSAFFTATPISGSAPLQVDFTNLSDANAVSFDWDFGDGYTETSLSPTHVFNEGGQYDVELTVVNAEGCFDSYSMNIEVVDIPSFITIPNVFTPNGDKNNDEFFVTAERIENFNLQILNRWGNLILTIQDPTMGWDGTINGNLATEGTYFYQITAKGLDQKQYNETGFFELVR